MPEPVPEPLLDSSPVLGDGPALLERFCRDGYLFLRDALPASEVLDVRADVLAALASVDWLAPGTDPADAVPSALARVEADENWWDGYTAIQSLERFHRLAHHDTLVDVARTLLDDDVLVHPRKIGRVGYPGTGVPTPPHQDFVLIQGAVDVLTMWVPFGDITQEMGALRLLEGSHARLMEPVPAAGIGGIGVTVDPDGPGWRTTEYRPGDVLVFLSLTVHHAPPNTSNRLRLSADYRYQSAHEPVVEGSLLPHMHPGVPGWDVLTAGWSSTEWVDRPGGLTLDDVRMPDATLRAPESRFRPDPAGAPGR